ncbi:MAG TPA: adenylate/guanylate cyclase domain-containing protein [Gaiellaceae bacterium]|nr:adenylate/guanylate cyclase domain-containing protein [Gaiellaceae bacterium]
MLACTTCGRENPDGARFCNGCGATLAAVSPPREVRKTVTVLFCDLTGSTELGERLDPEALRSLLAGYFERTRDLVQRHGGSVEKFIGDAVMAVFGIPVVHEDDALRALRAAVEMRDALPELGIEGRIGVMTGEVVTGTAERLATGDAVNVAARLEQAAAPGEILIGDETFRLAHGAALVEALPPLDVKGKSAPLQVHRLLAVHGDEAFARRLDAPLVGRLTELGRLRSALDQARADRSCQLFTILGSAGVGKSRLAAEFLVALDDAIVVRGRCLPYGEGITYWPVVEIVKQLPGASLDASSRHGIRALLGEEQGAAKEEIARAFRKLLESIARERAVVCVFDDVHWGEETFLDLVEHVADLSRDAPILLLCIARPELLDARPGWAGGKVNSTSVLLEPLGDEEAQEMIASIARLDEPTRRRILDAAEGNPLFVEQMVALVSDSADGAVTVPPTIQALLSARLEQLDEAERAVLERGAVEGRIFHQGAVQALAPEETRMTTRLASLVRKELVRPDKPQFHDEDAYRFRHVLIRDAAYDALPKSVRAELHERFAEWLDRHGQGVVELDELLGYHLEQAYRCRVDLGLADDRTAAIGRRAADRLAAAGRRAFDRADIPAAVSLLERADAVLAGDDPARLQQLPLLGRALIESGNWDRATAVLEEARDRGTASGDRRAVADAAVELAFLSLHTDRGATHAQIGAALADAARDFEGIGDGVGVARALALAGRLPFWAGDTVASMEHEERAAAHARAAGSRAQEVDALTGVLLAMVEGPPSAGSILERLEQVSLLTSGSSRSDVGLRRMRADVELMLGRLESARACIADARALAEELGLSVIVATGIARTTVEIEFFAGCFAAAEREAAAACEVLQAAEDWGHFVSMVPFLVDALHAQARAEEAAAMVDESERLVIAEDFDAQVGLRRARSKLLLSRGDLAGAETVTRDALGRCEGASYVMVHARMLEHLADILGRMDREGEAAAARRRALSLYEAKGAVAFADRARAGLVLAAEPG